MSTKKNEIALLVGLAGILIAVATYIWVFVPYTEETELIEAEIVEQETRLNQLHEWSSNMDKMKEDTETMIGDVNAIFSIFPPKSKEEDAIMYAVELESQDPETYISAIGIEEPVIRYEAQPTSVKLKDSDEEATHTYQLYSQGITYTQQFNYNGMKRYVNSIVKDTDRRSIESLNLSYDSTTGILVGSTYMNLFTLAGTESDYEKTSIPPMPVGTPDIFATLNKGAFVPQVEAESAE